MAIYLYTVESAFRDKFGICAEQGIRLSEMATREKLKTLRQGVVLELRLPDSTRWQTHLMNYGVGVIRQDDGSFLAETDPFYVLHCPPICRLMLYRQVLKSGGWMNNWG